MVAIDASIVDVALLAIERDLGAGLLAQQWVSNRISATHQLLEQTCVLPRDGVSTA